jgi:pimeloyl-ACP methyl ester carboxylesterase
MTTIFTNETAKKALEASYEQFRAHIPGAQGRWVPTRFGDTHVLVAGRPEAPPLVLLHGALTGAAHMLSASLPFLERFRVYAPDILGHSVKSIDARLSYRGPACGQWLVDVMDALGVARAHVCGASLGGFMARKLAEHAPDRIDRMVLTVPAGIITAPAFTILSNFVLGKLIYRSFPSRDRLRRLMEAMMTNVDEEWGDYFGKAFRGFRLDLRMPPLGSPEPLARFTRPTLVFGASEDIFFPGAELIARAKVLFPRAETELLEGCRHVLPTDGEFAAWFRARVERFLGAEDAPQRVTGLRSASLRPSGDSPVGSRAA